MMFDGNEELEGGHQQDHTTVLADAVRGYPMGIGLVKEFLQNADDAGATELRVVYDRRRHPGPCDPQGASALDVVLEPALLFINDRVFSDEDLKGIRNIGRSVKFTRASGTGRFGKGFCTAFSVSDHPSILTRTSVMWFDPHHHAICSGEQTHRDTNMRHFPLRATAKRRPNWLRTFAVPGVEIGPESCPSTVFRLPLRNDATAPNSRISQQVFTDDVWERIIVTAQQLGPALLVFLRSVESLKLSEIDANGNESARLEIITDNLDGVRNARAPLREATDGETAALLERWLDGSTELPTVTFEHHFTVADGGTELHEEAWTVVSGLLRGREGALLELAHEVCTAKDPDKVLPWAGAAVCLRTTREGAVLGGYSCFLPVGDQDRPPPLWVHGWFDLDDKRSHLTRDFGGEGNASKRALWNQLLLEQGVGPQWARLVELLGTRPYEEGGDVYRPWAPPPEEDESLDSALSLGFYGAATKIEVMRVCSGDGYEMRAPDDKVRYLPSTTKAALKSGLTEDDVPFYDPRPPEGVRRGLERVGVKLEALTPEDLRDHFDDLQLLGNTGDTWSLDEAPSALLRGRERIEAVWSFFARKPSHINELIQTPLCLTSENRLRCFDADALIYTCTEEQDEILRSLPHRRLHPDCCVALNLGEREEELGVSPIDIADLSEFLHQLVERDGDITDDWAAAVLDDLVRRPGRELDREFETLRQLHLLPTEVGSRTPLGHCQTAALVQGRTEDAPRALLERLCVPVVRGSKRLHAAVAAALAHYPQMMNALTPHFAAKVLSGDHSKFFDPPTHAERLAALNTEDASELLTYLARVAWNCNDATDKQVLASLRDRLPLITNQGNTILANAKNLYRPTGAAPPGELVSNVVLLDVSGEGWADLAAALGVEELDDATLMLQHALPFLDTDADEGAKQAVRLWILRQAPGVLGEPEGREGGEPNWTKELRSALRAAQLLPLREGGTGSACEAYRSNSDDDLKQLVTVLGPNISVVAGAPPVELKRSQWDAALRTLRVPNRARASDILHAIVDASADWADPEKRDQALSRIRGIYAYLNESDRLAKLNERTLTNTAIERAGDVVCSAFSGPQTLLGVALRMRWNSKPPRLTEALKELRWLPAQPRMWVDEADDFKHRLYVPTDLYPPSQYPRVSAVRPVLALAEPNRELRNALSLRSAGAAEMDGKQDFGPIGEQLSVLLQQKPGLIDDAHLDKFRSTVDAVFTEIAGLADVKKALEEWAWPHQDELEVRVLVEKEWRHPSTVFFNRLEFANTPWIGAITGWDKRALSTHRPLLEAIGVRDLPEPADWVRLLSGLQEAAKDRMLTGESLNLANRALRALATRLREGSIDPIRPVFVLSDKSVLIEANRSYDLDRPRLQSYRDRLVLPIIKREKDNWRVARWAGVEPISGHVSFGNPRGSVVEDYGEADRTTLLLKLIAEHPDVWGGLVARLRYHYAILSEEDTDIDLAVVSRWESEAADLAMDLSITVYETLTLDLSFVDLAHETLSLDERYFVDHDSGAVHIREDELDYSLEEALAALALGRNISSAEAAEAGKTLLRVARAPRDARAILNRLDISRPPDDSSDHDEARDEVIGGPFDHGSGIGAAADEDAAIADEAPFQDQPGGMDESPDPVESGTLHVDAYDDDQPDDDAPLDSSEDSTENMGSASTHAVGQNHSSSPATPDSGAGEVRQSTATTGGEDLADSTSPGAGEETTATESRDGSSQRKASKLRSRRQRDKGPRKWREPGDRKVEGEERTKDTTSRQSSRQSRPRDRMVSYVTREGTTMERRHHERQEWERRADAGKLGEAAVLAHEHRKGWCAVQIGGNNPGYDIASSPFKDEDGPDMSHPDARYIEVKATRHAWDAYGVAISETQFEMARAPGYKSRWWLYVVEHVDSADPTIYEVPNPVADPGLQFRFDGGWTKWAERERAARRTAPPSPADSDERVGRRFRQRHPSGETRDFVVLRVERDIASNRLIARVQLDNGEERTMHNLDSWEPLD